MAKVEKLALHVPSLEELSGVLQNGLKENFADVLVSVVECPDLTRDPFDFPVKGICGKPRIADVGGQPHLLPLVQKDKVYDLNTVAKQIELPGAFILGAGAVSSRILGVNAEFIPVAQAESEEKPAVNASYTAQINPADGGCLLEKYSNKYSDCEFGLLANLYASQGQPGKVIEVKANGRTGQHNFVTCMRQIIEKCYGDKPVGIGGTFVIQKGKAKIHIMPPEFSACPLNTDEELNNWLRFFEMKAPLICQPVLISRDPRPEKSRTRACCAKHYLFVQRLSLFQSSQFESDKMQKKGKTDKRMECVLHSA
ncbi:ester hydrolase C11orf54 homolog isoform X2 [Trachemys scripta elegans]|uniref:ester hydrolase C11orf54 homolog isoform X2 n=1 Tax=Trachemys scripta elegans TaxID=31138 RepID=UPI0015565B08|nr:ester hydrolase C11orf54 homolog isoform X2 [Trachemys scripta elegans]